jgi:glucokinase
MALGKEPGIWSASLSAPVSADEVADALIAGAVTLVNAFNPCRLILGGGVIEGLPELIERVALGVRNRALAAASKLAQVLPAQLHGDVGVVGVAAAAMRKKEVYA